MSPSAPTSTLLLPPRDPLPPATPSGLTPHTRSEAEAAFTHNTTSQTDSAAPTTPLHTTFSPTEPHTSRRGNPGLIRASSTNYENALRMAHNQHSASSDLSTPPASPPAEKLSKLDINAAYPFPAPGEGVVPRYPEAGVVAAGQAEVVRKAKPLHLELGMLGRKQSWSAQDFRHVMQGMSIAGEESDDGGKGGVEV